MGSAFMGGLASGVPCSMLELTMIQQQRFGGSIAGTPTRLVSDLGMRALTRGMLPTLVLLLRTMP
jgi:solute carrier family 25 carnitine/acylcarnitine transporter 20/29